MSVVLLVVKEVAYGCLFFWAVWFGRKHASLYPPLKKEMSVNGGGHVSLKQCDQTTK